MTRIHPPIYGLTLPEAVQRLEEEVVKNATQLDTEQLQGMTPDQSYNVGYETCLRDLQSVTGPDPRELYLVRMARK